VNNLEKKAIIVGLRANADSLWALQKDSAALTDDQKTMLKTICDNLYGIARRLEKGSVS
jgi:hypothetical protein